MRRCQACFTAADATLQTALVAEESRAYMAAHTARQTWDGSEPGLQVLVMPDASGSAPPAYADHPEHLHPDHCRLCLRVAPQGGAGNWLATHLREAHQLTEMQYRARVLRRAVADWPQPISPQLLRSRLFAFKKALCDAEFRMAACAVCAREKRQCKLKQILFPAPGSSKPPAWLGWNRDEWREHGARWYNDVDALLSADAYLNHVFQADQRIADARAKLHSFVSGEAAESDFRCLEGVEDWVRRADAWKGEH